MFGILAHFQARNNEMNRFNFSPQLIEYKHFTVHNLHRLLPCKPARGNSLCRSALFLVHYLLCGAEGSVDAGVPAAAGLDEVSGFATA